MLVFGQTIYDAVTKHLCEAGVAYPLCCFANGDMEWCLSVQFGGQDHFTVFPLLPKFGDEQNFFSRLL